MLGSESRYQDIIDTIHSEISNIMNDRDRDDDAEDDQEHVDDFKDDLMEALRAEFTQTEYSPEDDMEVIMLLLTHYKSQNAMNQLYRSIVRAIKKQRKRGLKKPSLKMIAKLFSVVVDGLNTIKQTIPHDQTNEENTQNDNVQYAQSPDVPSPVTKKQVKKKSMRKTIGKRVQKLQKRGRSGKGKKRRKIYRLVK
jgi:hypothetical protein